MIVQPWYFHWCSSVYRRVQCILFGRCGQRSQSCCSAICEASNKWAKLGWLTHVVVWAVCRGKELAIRMVKAHSVYYRDRITGGTLIGLNGFTVPYSQENEGLRDEARWAELASLVTCPQVGKYIPPLWERLIGFQAALVQVRWHGCHMAN